MVRGKERGGRSNRRDFLRRDQDQSGYARFYAFHHVQQPYSKHVEEKERVSSDRKRKVRIDVDAVEWWEECEWPKTHASWVQSIGK
ncbi:hypothetical protein V1478_000582, partial [Vespula squamosa]